MSTKSNTDNRLGRHLTWLCVFECVYFDKLSGELSNCFFVVVIDSIRGPGRSRRLFVSLVGDKVRETSLIAVVSSFVLHFSRFF